MALETQVQTWFVNAMESGAAPLGYDPIRDIYQGWEVVKKDGESEIVRNKAGLEYARIVKEGRVVSFSLLKKHR